MQATSQPSATGSSFGGAAGGDHVGAARGEGAPRLAGGGRDGAGNFCQPLRGVVPDRRLAARLAHRGAKQAARIGVARAPEERPHRRLLDDAAGIHHRRPVRPLRDDAEVVGDQQHRHAELPAQAVQQVQHLRLDRDVQRRRRLVGDDQLRAAGDGDCDHHPLAHPAGELVRELVHPAPRLRDADQVQQLDRPAPRRAPGHPLMPADHLHDLRAHGQHRVQRRHRLLHDERDALAPDAAQRRGRSGQKVCPAEQHAAAQDAGRGRQQAQQGERGDRLAAPAFSHQRQGLTRGDVEVDAMDGDAAGETDGKVLHMQQRRHAHQGAPVTRRPYAGSAPSSARPRPG